MKLFWSTSSPFARKARVVLREKQLLDEVDEIECNPFADPASLRAANPLGLIPTLVLDDGRSLYDSPVICAYLDALTARHRLIPAGPAQWAVRRAEALADGLLDLAVGITVELRRPPTEQSPAGIERRRRACADATAEMGRALAGLPRETTLGHIAIACACGYMDFRPASIGAAWRDANPVLADWYAAFESRPSFVQTRPDDGSYARFPRATPAPPHASSRAWMRLPSGRHLDLMNPTPDDWSDEDLAVRLARTFRWGGESRWPRPLSVAQHSLTVLEIVKGQAPGPLSSSQARRELLHDAEEGFLGFDCISPLKRALGQPFADVTDRLMAAVQQRYRLPRWTPAEHALHKWADVAAAATEAAHVVGWSDVEIRDVLRIDFAVLDIDPLVGIYRGTPWEPWPADVAAERFLAAMTQYREPGVAPSA